MQITPFGIDDIAALTALQPPDWQDVTPHFKYYIESEACWPLKISQDGFTVGVGTVIQHQDTAWLAHIIVHPDFRNQSIGKVLTQALLDSIDKEIFKTIYLMATPMGEPVYKKLGFVEETEQLFMRDGQIEAYQPVSQIRPYSRVFQDAILKMDAEISGENRSWKLLESLQDAMVYTDDHVLKGYYMPALGEGLVVANDSVAGLHLMKYRLQTHPVAILAVDNKIALDFLNDHAYKVFRTAKRMRLGVYRPFHAQSVYNRVSGQIG